MTGFTTALAGVRSCRGVDALVQSDSGGILEAFATHSTLTRVGVTVLVQVVLLQMHLYRQWQLYL